MVNNFHSIDKYLDIVNKMIAHCKKNNILKTISEELTVCSVFNVQILKSYKAVACCQQLNATHC